MTNTGKELEQLIEKAYRAMGAWKVEHDVELAGNQIDIYVEMMTPGHHRHRVAVEAKDWSSKVGIDIVNGFAVRVSLLRNRDIIDEGVIVSAKGFSKQAKNAAQTHNITLRKPDDLKTMAAAKSQSLSPTSPSESAEPTPSATPPSREQQSADLEAKKQQTPPAPQQNPSPSTGTPETILIPSGPFQMGSDLHDSQAHANEKPRHKIKLPEYQIGRYPITNAQYAHFVRDTGHASPEHWDGENVPAGLQDHPVVHVNHADAETYCRWLSETTGKHYRLPTEAEWEKAARGSLPETRRYPWGNEWQSGVCNTEEMGRKGTTSVHKFERVNRSPFGVVDMAGNVWEWMASWYERYPGSPHEGQNYERKFRVVRGGSWDYPYREARVSCRGRYKPNEQRAYLGFRVALEAESQTPDSNTEEPSEPKMAEPIKQHQLPETSSQISNCNTEKPENTDPAKLYQLIDAHFDKEELRTLCFYLKVDYDSLRGEGKAAKARELVAYFNRHESISDLVEACQQRRPRVSW